MLKIGMNLSASVRVIQPSALKSTGHVSRFRISPCHGVTLTVLKGRHYNRTGGGRLAQRESACFTRKRPLVQIQYRPPLDRRRAEVAEWQTRCVQGAVSERACGFKSHLRHHDKLPGAARLAPTVRARSSVRIERSPAEAEVVGSSPTERAILLYRVNVGLESA